MEKRIRKDFKIQKGVDIDLPKGGYVKSTVSNNLFIYSKDTEVNEMTYAVININTGEGYFTGTEEVWRAKFAWLENFFEGKQIFNTVEDFIKHTESLRKDWFKPLITKGYVRERLFTLYESHSGDILGDENTVDEVWSTVVESLTIEEIEKVFEIKIKERE